jgi:hypothetical protein
MAINSRSAYDATCQEAHEIVKSCVASVLQGIKDGEVSRDDLNDRVHQECNDSLIYTVSHYVCVWGLPDENDAIEDGLSSPSNFGEALAAQAFCNLENAVNYYSDEFESAFQVREDSEGDES